MADPVGWMLGTDALGTGAAGPDPVRVDALLAAVRAIVPGAHPPSGLALPWGLELRTTAAGGTFAASLALPAPVDLGALRVAASAGLTLGTNGALAPSLAVTLDLTDEGAPAAVLGGIDVSFVVPAAINAAARLPLGASLLTVPLLPASGGLGGLAATAARALPLALDALTAVGTHGGVAIGPLVGALGDALDLRVAAAFDLAQLEALAANPAAELTARLALATNRVDFASALRLLLDPVLPGTVGGTGAVVSLQPGAHLAISLDLAPTVPELCVEAIGVIPVDGLVVDAELCVGTGGVRVVSAEASVASDDLLLVGQVALLPSLSFTAGSATSHPAGLVELALWTAAASAPQREAVVVQLDVADGVTVRWRTPAGDVTDLAAAALGLARAYLLPIAAEVVLQLDDVRAVLDGELLSTGSDRRPAAAPACARAHRRRRAHAVPPVVLRPRGRWRVPAVGAAAPRRARRRRGGRRGARRWR